MSKIEEVEKYDTEHLEVVKNKDGIDGIPITAIDAKGHHHDAALDVLGVGGRVAMTEEQSRLVCRKIDRVVLPLLMWVYFLQILDKSTIGYGSIFGLQTNAHLVGNQYSLIGSVGYWAQLGWQPFSAILIVKVPTRILMPIIVTLWGASLCGMAASTNFKALMVSRFFLGLFEASCLPLFALVTITWYRRAEQPFRIACWYGTNGIASMLGSALSYGLAHIKSDKLHSYQIIFLATGLMTVITGPVIYFRLDNNPAEARFLTPEERAWAVERLRDNNTGIETKEVKWPQIWETLISPKTWMFFAIAFCLNTGASVTSVFGPLIISGFGFDNFTTILLNIPYGFLQFIFIMLASWIATRYRMKGVILMILMIPCVAGSAALYKLGRGKQYTPPLLASYYLLAFLFAGNPLLVSWMSANTAGTTKKALTMSLYNAGSSVGNIVGPLLFTVDQKPLYHAGLQSTMAIFCALVGVTGITLVYLIFLNRLKAKERVRNGKPAKITDRSMDLKFKQQSDEELVGEEGKGIKLGEQAFLDLTDSKNDEFVYVY